MIDDGHHAAEERSGEAGAADLHPRRAWIIERIIDGCAGVGIGDHRDVGVGALGVALGDD